MKQLSMLATAAALVFFAACSSNEKTERQAVKPGIKEERIAYTADGTSMNGYVAYDSSRTKMPVVLVVHEWWGQNDYSRSRAKQLAELGYLAMAVDMYGNGATADNPDAAGKLAAPFYADPKLTSSRFEAALAKALTHPQADSSKTAAIGYCFGGAVVLNMARMGSRLNGVVSFHGNLLGVPADKNLLKSRILVCHGAADSFVPEAEVAQFKKQMDSIGTVYTFKAYPGATHAFTNPGATAMGEKFKLPIAYNAAADSASWNDMKGFFSTLFQ